jgi:hypothetical protein
MSQGNAKTSLVIAACANSGSPAKESHYLLAAPILAAWAFAEGARPTRRIDVTGRSSMARRRDVQRFRAFADAIGEAFTAATTPAADDAPPPAPRIDPLLAGLLADPSLQAKFRTRSATGEDADLFVSLVRTQRTGRLILRMVPKFFDHASAILCMNVAREVCAARGFRIALVDAIKSSSRPNTGAIVLHLDRSIARSNALTL